MTHSPSHATHLNKIRSRNSSMTNTLNKDSSQVTMKIFTGTAPNERDKAHRTYLNELGPGQYNLPSLTGRHSLESKRRNLPHISFAQKTKAPWYEEMHTDFVGKSSPPSTRYSPCIGKKSGERSTTKMGQIGTEQKFRQPTSVTKLKEDLPV